MIYECRVYSPSGRLLRTHTPKEIFERQWHFVNNPRPGTPDGPSPKYVRSAATILNTNRVASYSPLT